MRQRPLILVSNRVESISYYRQEEKNDCAPRRDFVELAQYLNGQLAGYDLPEVGWYRAVRKLERLTKIDATKALSTATEMQNYNVILSTSEKNALPLAMILPFMSKKPSLVVIAHKLSSGSKTTLLKGFNLHRAFTHVICLCRTQVEFAVRQLKLPPHTVDFVYDKIDHHFFRPLGLGDEGYVLAVGQEQRDYPTLLQAIAGTNLKLVVVASSPWSTFKKGDKVDKTDQVTTLSNIPYQELRALYDKARLVVTPLYNVDYAAGVNSVLEGMAMAKPVIVSQSPGISDYIINGETGVFTPPGDPDALRDTILSLWEQPAERARLGQNARQIVEEQINLDIYVKRVSEIVQRATNTSDQVTVGI